MWINAMQLTLLALCCMLAGVCSQQSGEREQLLEWCVDGRNNLTKPGPEDELHQQCSPWRERACCTENTTRNVHISDMVKFTWNHCGDVKHMSFECRRHFIQDLCFYECEPNLGPWSLVTLSKVIQMNTTIHKERFYEVPLCASDCESWFEACSEDLTCVDNWVTKFDWQDGVNRCPSSEPCRTYKEVFKTAEHFCNNIWDHSWKYVPDSQSCMRLWFNGTDGSPNRQVAEVRAEKMFRWNHNEFGYSAAGQSPLACSVFVIISALLVITIISSL